MAFSPVQKPLVFVKGDLDQDGRDPVSQLTLGIREMKLRDSQDSSSFLSRDSSVRDRVSSGESVWPTLVLSSLQLYQPSGLPSASLPSESDFKSVFEYNEVENPASMDPYLTSSILLRPEKPSEREREDGSENLDEEASYVMTTRKIFVGRVPKGTTQEQVVAFFSTFGTVESADVNADRGCCFVTFMDTATVDDILEQKNVRYLEMDGAEVCVRRYVIIEKDKVFVRGLAPETTKDDLFKYFKQFGRIVNVTLHNNKSGSHPFSFIRFLRPKSVNQIMARNDHMINGRVIHCLRAHKQEKQNVAGVSPQSGSSGYSSSTVTQTGLQNVPGSLQLEASFPSSPHLPSISLSSQSSSLPGLISSSGPLFSLRESLGKQQHFTQWDRPGGRF